MISSIADDLFFYQKLKFKKKYSNREIYLLQYFHKKTKMYPQNVLVIQNFIFYFVRNEDYFKAKLYLKNFRKDLDKKILVIRDEKILIKLLFSFFPDPYIHDIKIEMNIYSGKKIITICFLSFKGK